MASKTEFLELIKPLAEEFYDIAILNGNMDIIDTAIKELQNNKANGTDLTELRDVVTTHLEQTTYQKYVGSLKDIDYTCNVYADGSTTDRPNENASWNVDAMVRPELKDSFRTLIAYRATGIQLEIKYLKMVNGVWGEWIDYTTELRNLINAKYTKPSTGIPQTDLTSALQTTLSNLKSGANQDYEEGIWIPTLTADSGTFTGYVIQNGRYRKIGKTIMISGVLQTTDTSSVPTQLTGALKIGGLPFVGNYVSGSVTFGFMRGFKTTGLILGEVGGSVIVLSVSKSDASYDVLNAADATGGTIGSVRIKFSATYLID